MDGSVSRILEVERRELMRLKLQALALILTTAASTLVHADLGHLDPLVQQIALARANELFLKRDIPELQALLHESHPFVKQDVALTLGRLGAQGAIEELRQLNQAYATFACAESGQFGVAVVLIENPEKARQRKALLDLATEVGGHSSYANSVIDLAGRELSRFEGDDIEERLTNVNTYGAQFTVLALQCRKLSTSDAIAKCIKVLQRHETPQKAQAAQTLLIASGKPAMEAVRELKARVEANIKTADPTFTLPKTIANSCERILQTISDGEAVAAPDGDKPSN